MPNKLLWYPDNRLNYHVSYFVSLSIGTMLCWFACSSQVYYKCAELCPRWTISEVSKWVVVTSHGLCHHSSSSSRFMSSSHLCLSSNKRYMQSKIVTTACKSWMISSWLTTTAARCSSNWRQACHLSKEHLWHRWPCFNGGSDWVKPARVWNRNICRHTYK